MTDSLINRAQILLQQNRFEEAGNLLKDILRQDPNNVHVLAMLAQVQLQQDNVLGAEQLINDAIGLSPDTDYLYFIKARVELQNEKYDEAEKNLELSIQINPYDADYFALWASVKLARKQYAKALELADEALEVDPENLLGLNTRSTALLKLNRKEDSFTTIEGALSHDPNNAYTHSNYGWALLEKGDHKKALEHFREALKNDPGMVHAQAGMGEALKAKYLFYRVFLRYSFFMSNLASKNQWAIILGFYFGSRLLNYLAKTYPSLQVVLLPLLVLMAVFAFSTWVITPLSNLFLRLNPYGKYLLNKEEKLSSNFVGGSLSVCILGLVLYFTTSSENYLLIALFGFAMMVPFGAMFLKKKNYLVIYAGALFLTGIAGISTAFMTGELYNVFNVIFVVGFIAFQWIANFARIKQGNI